MLFFLFAKISGMLVLLQVFYKFAIKENIHFIKFCERAIMHFVSRYRFLPVFNFCTPQMKT